MRRLATTIAILLVAAGIGWAIRVSIHHQRASGTSGAPTTTGPGGAPTTVPVDIVPAAGQSFVHGTLTSLSADNAIGPPLKPPFTITVAARGQGHADLTGVAVAGHDVEIFWYGGQPLPVSGTGELAIDGGPVKVDASGITWMLDGAPRSLTSGHFSLGAPVAVGSGGLATPHQSIAFDAGNRSTLQTTGHAQVHLAPTAVHMTGPGSVTLHGDFQIQTAAGRHPAQTVVFGPGSYAIDITPVAAGATIQATLQGPVTLN